MGFSVEEKDVTKDDWLLRQLIPSHPAHELAPHFSLLFAN